MMMRISWFGLFALFSFSVVGCPPPTDDDDDDLVAPPDDDDDEACDVDTDCRFTSGLEICSDAGVCTQGDRNNSTDEAQLLEYDSSTELVIAPAGDIDYFRFSGTQGDLVLMTTFAENTDSLDTVVTYIDSEGDEIAYNDDFERVSTVPPDSRLYSGVPSTGTFYFSVQDRRSWANDPSEPPVGGEMYGYAVTLGRAPGDTLVVVADEDNDDPSVATEWNVETPLMNYTLGGFLEPTGDSDFLAIPVVEGQALRIYGFPNSGSLGTTQVTAYLPDGVTPIDTWESLAWDIDHRAWIPVLETGTYYLEVREADGRGGFDYWYYLHAAKNAVEDGQPSETEPNDEVDSATLLEGSTTRWARIHPAGDEDWYTAEGTDGARLTVRFNRTDFAENTRLQVTLYDPSGEVELDLPWDGLDDENVIAVHEISAGTWTLRLREQNAEVGDEANRFYQFTATIQK